MRGWCGLADRPLKVPLNIATKLNRCRCACGSKFAAVSLDRIKSGHRRWHDRYHFVPPDRIGAGISGHDPESSWLRMSRFPANAVALQGAGPQKI